MIYHLYHTLRYFGNQTFGLCFQRHDLYFPGNFTQPDFLFRINALGKERLLSDIQALPIYFQPADHRTSFLRMRATKGKSP